MEDGEAFYPLSLRALALTAAGLVTALPPWWIAGSAVSAVGHTLLGGAFLFLGLWGTWRPLVVVGRDVVHYRPRLAPGGARAIPLAEVKDLLPTPRTGHAPSERDLAAWLGVRLSSGEVRWLDLAELRARDRARVRSCLERATHTS